MKQISSSDLELIEQSIIEHARVDFWTYRQYMRPNMVRGWWQREVAKALQEFHEGFIAGDRPALAIMAPPQHGKSEQITEFLEWCLGRHYAFPETCGVFSGQKGIRQVYGSFSERLGARANTRIQRAIRNPKFQKVFPGVRLPTLADKESANRDIVELPGSDEAYFRNTTVGGAITGEGLDLGAVDDPIKGRADANSPTVRDKAWDWFTDDLFSRFSEYASLLIILTRWHVDDPLGRLEDMHRLGELDMNFKALRYKAVATEDEPHREAGEALFPELKSLEFLQTRKSLMTESNWEALYQQSPYISSGGMFPIARFQFLDHMPQQHEVTGIVRYWDKAGTKDGDGAETAGVKMLRLRDGRFVIPHVEYGRWGALEREQKIKFWASADGYACKVFVEQEPGSGGKESAEYTVRNLPGFTVAADRPTGDKATRAEPYAAQVQGSNVWLMRGDWNAHFLEQHEQFPNGKLKDIVDAASGAFAKVAGSNYNLDALAS